MTSKTISILGLGWLGKPLAKSLLLKGYSVKGSVTSTEKADEFIDSDINIYILKVEENRFELSNPDFFNTDVLFINIPPKRIQEIEKIYPAQISQLIPHILKNKIGKVIFVSSTSVYPTINRMVTEDDLLIPDKASGIACLNAEKILKKSKGFDTTIIRFGGLIGADRNPHRYMKRGIKNSQAKVPVNLIHLDDCIRIIEHIMDNKIWGEIINGCCPVHPTREEFYKLAAKVAGVEAPVFDNNDSSDFKIVSSEKLINKLGYTFKYKNPTDFF